MDVVHPLDALGLGDGREFEVDDDGLLAAAHDDALERRVGGGVDLLVRHEGWDKDEVAGTGVGDELEGLAPAHARPPAHDVDDALQLAVVVGAVLSNWYNGRAKAMPNPARAERLGTLVASGLIVGESLWGVLNAGLIVGLSSDAPIGLVAEGFAAAPWLGVLGFVGAIAGLYGWMLRRSAAAPGR